MAALAEIAAQISAAERRAMLAERETADRLIAHFLADRIGATFEGRISGVTRAGLFVRLDDTGADGFIPARTIGNEYFRYEEGQHAMVGSRTGETYRLGDRVAVQAGRGRAGRRRAALRAALGRPHGCAAPQQRPSERRGPASRGANAGTRKAAIETTQMTDLPPSVSTERCPSHPQPGAAAMPPP